MPNIYQLVRRGAGLLDLLTSSPALEELTHNPKTENFAKTLDQSLLPSNWANDNEIVDMAGDLYKQYGTDSPFFQSYFQNSKIVNKNGKPLPVYHGTRMSIDDDFAFDRDKIGRYNGAFYGKGFYTAKNFDDALDYADGDKDNVLQLFSKIVKPTTHRFATDKVVKKSLIGKDKIEKILEKMVDKEDDFDNRKRDSVYSIIKNRELEPNRYDAQYAIDILQNEFDYDYKKISDAIRDSSGFDGIYIPTKNHYVNFFPEDLKSKKNRGTFNTLDPRIGYGFIPAGVGYGLLDAIGQEGEY